MSEEIDIISYATALCAAPLSATVEARALAATRSGAKTAFIAIRV
jgi:hypothetical protein